MAFVFNDEYVDLVRDKNVLLVDDNEINQLVDQCISISKDIYSQDEVMDAFLDLYWEHVA